MQEYAQENRNGSSGWWALGLGALAGAAGLAYLAYRQRDIDPRPADSAPARTARHRRSGDYAIVGRTVTIDRPRVELYAYWRDFSNLPRFMENIEAVLPAGDQTWRWSISAPAGRTVEVVTRLIDEVAGESLAWRSTEDSQIDTEGRITFREAPSGRGTEVEAELAYKPPAGELGRWIAKLFQKEPAIQGRRDLKRLKMLMETGEIATASNRKSET